jgi:methionyl-tRNA formyltransferase
MKLVFFGTPEFACESLGAVHKAGHKVFAVVSQPDRCCGRGLKKAPCPVKALGQELGMDVLQPETAEDPAFIERIRGFAPEVCVVVAYGQLLKKALLDIPPHGFINVHPSLLPKYRGSAPAAHAILNGETETGVSIMRLVRKMDAGPVCLQRTVGIGENETAGELEKRLAVLGAELLIETLRGLETGAARFVEQDEKTATVVREFEKSAGKIDWRQPALRVKNLVHAMNPWPGAFTFIRKTPLDKPLRLTVHKAMIPPGAATDVTEPGTVAGITPDGIVVRAADGYVVLTELQPESKKAMKARDFANGYRIAPGMGLGIE